MLVLWRLRFGDETRRPTWLALRAATVVVGFLVDVDVDVVCYATYGWTVVPFGMSE